MKTVMGYLKPFRLRIILGFLTRVISSLAEIVLPFILSHILKNVILHEELSEILYWGLFMAACAGIACGAGICSNLTVARVNRDFSENLRQDLFSRTIRLSARQTGDFTIASLESRITTDTYNVHQFAGMIQRLGVRAPILLVGGIAMTLFMDRYLSMVMLAVLPVSVIIITLVSRLGIPLYGKAQKSLDRMVRIVREDAQGIRVIKALAKDEYENTRYDAANRNLVRAERHAGMVMGAMQPVMSMIINMGMVLVIALSADRVAHRQSNPETVIAFMQYFVLITNAVMGISRIFAMGFKSAASAKRIEEILLCEDEMAEADEKAYPAVPAEQLAVSFDHVNFSYDGGKQNAEDICFRLSAGETLGIIGATGCGKSTIIKLLLRHMDVDSGQIRLYGRDIRTIDRGELYSHFGTVMQNDFLYSDTIEENIRFGREIPHEKVVEAAKMAQADEFITEFPEGYQHYLSPKATNISGGQKQRILIARALAGDPEILILDDSSSALDYRTEAKLRQALRSRKITRITVAQRVSAVMSCSRILVMNGGRIIGSGTHQQLMETCREYREISQSQTGGAQDGQAV